LPQVVAAQYEIKSSIIQMLPSFYGFNNEDSYKHLDEFLEICSTIMMQDFLEDASLPILSQGESHVLVQFLRSPTSYH
jgi:hypothetical protein